MNTITAVGQRPRKRHQDNPDLRLWHYSRYFGLSVQTAHGPLIANYLDTTLRVINQARQAHSKILAVPLILRYPVSLPTSHLLPNNTAIRHFLDFVKWELSLADLTHSADMRHIWAREQEISDKPHYHVWLFFNGNALKTLGTVEPFSRGSDEAYGSGCLYHRIVRAWARVIGWPLEDMKDLVYVPEDSITKKLYVYHFHRGDHNAYQQVFYGASYSCKAESKRIGEGYRCFDSSRL